MKVHLTHTEGTDHLGRHIPAARVMRDSNLEIGLEGEWTKRPVAPVGKDVLQKHSDTLAFKSGRSSRALVIVPFTIDLKQSTLGIAGIDNLEILSINIKYV